MSGANAFTGARLDRAGDARRRDAAWVAAQRADPAARAVLAGDAGVVMEGDRLAIVPLAEAPRATRRRRRAAAARPRRATGRCSPSTSTRPQPGGERPPRLIAAGAPRGSGAERPAPADGPRPVGLREAAAVLPQEEGGLAAYVAALLNWHRRHAFCAACGAPSERRRGRPGPHLPALRHAAPPAHGPGRDHARHRRRRPRAAGPRAELAAAPLLRAGRLRRAGGEPRGGRRARGRRGERRGGRRRRATSRRSRGRSRPR